MDPGSQLKKLAPFLDPHLLLLLLKKNVGEESLSLQQQIEAKLLSADPVKAKELEEKAAEKSKNILNLLNNNQECFQLRITMGFTLEKLGASEHKITIDDCQALFDYAKILYEMQNYVCKSFYIYHVVTSKFRG